MRTIAFAGREATAAAREVGSPASLEQIREIILGPWIRELDRRLAQVDGHVVAEAEGLRTEVRRRLDVLEAHIKRESDALVERLESERTTRAEAVSVLEQKISRTSDALSRAHRELRQEILDQAKSFLDETQRTREELVAAIDREIADEPALDDSSDEQGH